MSKNTGILDRLKDDDEYYSGIGKQFLSASDIGDLLKNPKNFKRESTAPIKNLMVGRYFHQLILEPEKAAETLIVDASTRTTKKYKDALEELSVNFALLKSEAEDVKRLTDVMMANLDFFEMVRAQGNEYEVPAVGKIFDLDWKGKTDILGTDYLYDLKTTSDIDDFYWSAKKYNYDSQAWIYQQLFGKPLIFLVIDKGSARMGKFECSDEFLNRGKEKVERAVDVYHKFFGPLATDDVDDYYITETL